jgi:hypothetical protein
MEKIIDPIDKALLIRELSASGRLRKTYKGQNEIYIITHHNSPNVMMEIARLREVTFRHAGGGTGKSFDLDEFDTCTHPYSQLLVWNPADQEIVGAYRYIKLKDAEMRHGELFVATTELFEYSEKFVKNYLPYTIELGRSWIQPSYQPSEEFRKGLFSLDNLWDGLGVLVIDNPDIHYFFGKVTMYTHFNVEARDMILAFMHYYFPDDEHLMKPKHPLGNKTDVTEFLQKIKGLPYKEGHAVLNQLVRALGENIPPLVNAYMNLSPEMKTFGTSGNPGFGDVEETGIMIEIRTIYPTKKDRHLNTYVKEKEERGRP